MHACVSTKVCVYVHACVCLHMSLQTPPGSRIERGQVSKISLCLLGVFLSGLPVRLRSGVGHTGRADAKGAGGEGPASLLSASVQPRLQVSAAPGSALGKLVCHLQGTAWPQEEQQPSSSPSPSPAS